MGDVSQNNKAGDGNAEGTEGRRVTYCLIPPELAPKLHDLLRHHFAERPDVEVVVEQRTGEQRRGHPAKPAAAERRPRAKGDRRIGERRAAQSPVEALPLPRRARRHAAEVSFVQRLEPSTEEAENIDTARVVARVQAGDGEAFSILYTRYFDRVYAYLRVALRNHDDAEDATQEVFARVFEKLPTYERRREPFRNWLFTVVRNQALGELRKAGRIELKEQEVLDRLREDEGVEDDLQIDAFDWISDPDLLLFVERLPKVQREVLVLRYTMGLTHKEIAEMLGKTLDDIKAYHHRAILFLRKRLEAIGKGPAAERRGRPGAEKIFRQQETLRHRRFALYK